MEREREGGAGGGREGGDEPEITQIRMKLSND